MASAGGVHDALESLNDNADLAAGATTIPHRRSWAVTHQSFVRFQF